LSNGRIIVKDAGITSSKLNLSVNGASQNIAQFKTVQGSSARALSIRTPASTSDITSPFEIETENAIKFLVDDHTVTIDSNGKTLFGNGPIGIGDTPLSQVNINTDDALGATAGNSQGILRLVETTGNSDNLLFTSQRVSDGSDWQTAAHRIQRKVDSTKMGYIQLGNNNETNGGLITFGENETERMRIDAEGHVGIGTTTPSEALEVSGNILATNGTESVQLNNTGSIEIRHSSGPFIDFKNANEDRDCRIFQNSDGLGFQVGGSSAVATKMELTSDGKVQIKGQISNGDAQLQLVSDSGSDASILAFGDNGDSDVGGIRYDHSDNSMRFATSTSEHVRIKSDGKVGIGITSPDELLTVHGSSNPKIHIRNSAEDDAGIKFSDDEDVSGQHFEILHNSDNTHDFRIKSNSTDNILFLKEDGKVGILNNAPAYALDVTGEIKSSDDIRSGSNAKFISTYSSGNEVNLYHGSTYGVVGTTGSTKMAIRTNNTDRVTVLSSGNVGIGTVSPDGKLHVGTGNNNDGTDIDVVLGGDTANSRQAIITKKIQSSDRALEIYASGSTSDEDIRFFSDTGTERMRIMSTGNVGIGDTNPSAPLEVAGDIHCSNLVGREEGSGILIKSDPEGLDGTNGGSVIQLYSKQFSALDPLPAQAYYNAQFHTFGNLNGLGNTGITLSGNFTSSGTVTCSSLIETSDRRLKDNITPLTGSLDKICQLNPVSYNDLTDEDKTLEFGLIAQDVQSVFPNLVRENVQEQIPEAERGESYLGVHYTQLIAPLIESIKELKLENEALKTRVAALES
jgi:hypothetical protein